MREMIGIGILFCLIFVNCFGGIDGVGEEADNGNDQRDLFFGEMWRKAFEANRHNGKEREEEEEETVKKEVKKEEQTEEKEEEEEKKEYKLWQKVKVEPINDQLKEEEGNGRNGQNWQKLTIKGVPKIEGGELEDLMKKSEIGESDQNELKKLHKGKTTKKNLQRSESEEGKWEIIEKFNKMRNANRNKYKNECHAQMEREIAKELGKSRAKIYAWKKELITREKKPESEKEKWEIIENFDRMRNEYRMKKGYKWEKRHKTEREIAKELGESRGAIYKWKRELIQKRKPESEEEKWEIIEQFDKMRKECKKKRGYTNVMRGKIEREIAKALGTCRTKIYRWKKELNQWKEPAPEQSGECEERKRKIIEKFDRMRKEYQMKKGYKNKDRIKIEQKIAKKLGTSRTDIYELKKALTPSRVLYTKGQKRAIVEKFDKLCEKFSNKFNRKTSQKIEEKIAKKFYVCRMTIYMWKKAFEKDEA